MTARAVRVKHRDERASHVPWRRSGRGERSQERSRPSRRSLRPSDGTVRRSALLRPSLAGGMVCSLPQPLNVRQPKRNCGGFSMPATSSYVFQLTVSYSSGKFNLTGDNLSENGEIQIPLGTQMIYFTLN